MLEVQPTVNELNRLVYGYVFFSDKLHRLPPGLPPGERTLGTRLRHLVNETSFIHTFRFQRGIKLHY